MMLMRPVTEKDIDELHELAQLTQHGLTTLSKTRSVMEKRVRQSVRSFQHLEDADPEGQPYLFVLEDTVAGRVVGTSGIVSKVGGFKPFYAYRIAHETQHSESLSHQVTHEVLHLVKQHDGPSEIGSLFLHPDYRGGGNGRLLSTGRFLFMAQHPERFEGDVIAEMRGVIDANGNSPFWDAIGSHFFPLDLPNADMLSLTNKDFIEELMPQHPIYLDLLSDAAQNVVASVHPNTAPARKMLESEGFIFQGLVDIFEAGPILHCERDKIRAVANSRIRTVTANLDNATHSERVIAASTNRPFRATLTTIEESPTSISIDPDGADTLRVGVGDEIRIVEIKGNAPESRQ